MVVLFMFKLKFFSILIIFLMVFSIVGSVSATVVSGNVNDGHEIVVDNPTIDNIQKAINKARDNYTILINNVDGDVGISDGRISCCKNLTIDGENCSFCNIVWVCSAKMTFKNCKFYNGKYGCIDSKDSVNICDCIFDGCSNLAGSGGAIRSEGSVNISGSMFQSCVVQAGEFSGGQGGAIYAENDVNVENSSFWSCAAHDLDGMFDASNPNGGAIYSNDGSVVLKNSHFGYNYAYYYGGAVYADDAVIVQDCSFTDNIARRDYGGAIYADDMGVKVTNSNFTSNSAMGEGGAIWSNEGVGVDGCNFVNNRVFLAVSLNTEKGELFMLMVMM